MDPTTLVTFLFRAPPEVRTVELLGSWDNFSTPYYMHHDRRRGRGFWSGCFHFNNIIFDGDRSEWTKPRSGGLKQGGTYWYFYRLNDAVEAFDDSQTSTQGCPLLPGQTLNVMDVPVEVEDPPSRPRSATIDVVGTLASLQRTHTLDPDDKWAALHPPPVSKVHDRCISDLALSGRLETKPHSLRNDRASPPRSPAPPRLAFPRQQSADDSHSFHSRNAWSSAPPSRGESSIFHAYAASHRGRYNASLSAFARPGVCGSHERPITRDGGRAYSGFDFAFDSTSTRDCASNNGDDDLEGSSFIFEPAESLPHSAYGSVDLRFTVSSAQQRSPPEGHQNKTVPKDLRQHRRSTSSPSSLAHRHSHDSADPSPSPFDVASPTFSAATISSHGGGLTTPFRLSAGYPRTSLPPSPSPPRTSPSSVAIDHITARLAHLASEPSAASLPSHLSSASLHASDRSPISHYALPLHQPPALAASATTLGKTSSKSGGRASIAPQDLPPLPGLSFGMGVDGGGDGGIGEDFADAIFSELGYLGGSIA